MKQFHWYYHFSDTLALCGKVLLYAKLHGIIHSYSPLHSHSDPSVSPALVQFHIFVSFSLLHWLFTIYCIQPVANYNGTNFSLFHYLDYQFKLLLLHIANGSHETKLSSDVAQGEVLRRDLTKEEGWMPGFHKCLCCTKKKEWLIWGNAGSKIIHCPICFGLVITHHRTNNLASC